MAEKITSRQNETVKQAAKLLRAQGRKEQDRFLLEGMRLCTDALNSKTDILELFYTPQAMERYPEQIEALAEEAGAVYEIMPHAAEKLSDTKQPQGVFCVCRNQSNDETAVQAEKLILLEQIANPSNLGAMIRTAEALGIGGAVLIGCCDPYSPKALRAAMGSMLRMPLAIPEQPDQWLETQKETGTQVLAAVVDPNAPKISEISRTGNVIVAIGNEGHGLSEALISACTQRVTIPMRGRAESLNAASAATILMYEMMRD